MMLHFHHFLILYLLGIYNFIIQTKQIRYCFSATLNFAVAIDFSRPDTFIDESFVRRYLQDVEIAVKSIGEPFRDFSVFV